MEDCWAVNPEERPTFQEISLRLNGIDAGVIPSSMLTDVEGPPLANHEVGRAGEGGTGWGPRKPRPGEFAPRGVRPRRGSGLRVRARGRVR